jgi:hypothetical protein
MTTPAKVTLHNNIKEAVGKFTDAFGHRKPNPNFEPGAELVDFSNGLKTNEKVGTRSTPTRRA